MATSGISILQLSRDDIINSALRKLGVLGLDQSASATQLTVSAMALNAIVSEFVAMGMPLWKRTDYNVTLVTSQSSYTLGVGQALDTPFPVKLLQARLQLGPNFDSDIEMNILVSYDYNLLPNASTGSPVNLNYQPFINYGVVRVWPTPDASVPATSRIVLTYQKPFEVFTAAADTPDFPQEWGNALIYQLALVLSDEYGLPEQKKGWLEKQANTHLATALSNGTEDGSIYFQKDWTR